MKLKELESELQPLQGFDAPKREFEQYVTSAHLAARMIYSAENSFGDIDDKRILDLGCGCAVLSCASVMMGASSVLSVDIDPDALAVAKQNIESLEMDDEITLHHARIEPAPSAAASAGKQPAPGSYPDVDAIPIFDPAKDFPGSKFDTVVMNPPFGSWRSGIDMVFLELACRVAEEAVYSLNKTSTRDFIMKKAKSFGFEGEVLAEMRYDLPKTMAFHKKQSLDIQVDFWRFSRIQPR